MYSLGYDIGSSSIKIALVHLQSGEVVGRASYPQQEMAIHSPQPGWAEQDPLYWWECVVQVTRQLFQQTKINPENIACIGIAYQMHGLVLVDQKQQVLRPAIIWCDSRAVNIGQQAFEQIGKQRALESLLNSPGNFTASKLRWVQLNEPDIYAKVYKAMLPGDYIAMRLTGEIQTTVTGLSEGIFWDFQQRKVSETILETYHLDKNLLPDIVPTIGKQHTISLSAAEEIGLPVGIPVSYRAGDQPNNALSLGVLQPGEIAATGGTSGVVYGITDKLLFDQHSRVNAFAHVNDTPADPRIGVLMCINGTGIQYRWLRQLLGAKQNYETLEQEAASVSVGAAGLSVLPFGNGAERILKDRIVGAHLAGIDFNRHQKAHLLRAGLEGIAFAFIYGIEILKEMGMSLQIMRVGDDNLFQSQIFSQTVATLSNCTIEMLHTTGAIGAASAAAVGAGHWQDLTAIQANLKLVKNYEPLPTRDLYDQAYENWRIELQKHI